MTTPGFTATAHTLSIGFPAPRDRTQAAKDLLEKGWSIDDVIGVLGGAPAIPAQPYPYGPFPSETVPFPPIWTITSTAGPLNDVQVLYSS